VQIFVFQLKELGYVSYHSTSKHQFTRLRLIPNRNNSRANKIFGWRVVLN